MDKVLRYVILLKYLVKKLTKGSTDNSLIIIKIEAIGDYLLFRNFLKTIRESKKYKGYRITLVGNVLWKDLAIEFDSKSVDEFIWIRPMDLNKLPEAKKIYDAVSSKRYTELITFHYSRSLATEILSLVVVAAKKTTMSGDTTNLKPSIKKLTDKIYSRVISVPDAIGHEFQKNRYFTSRLIGENVEIDKPELCIPDPEFETSTQAADKYVLVAPGAAVQSRQVSKATLQKVITFLLSKNIRLYFVGAENEAETVSNLLAPFDSHLITDLTGKTTLVGLAFLTKKAEAVICHDSSTYHLAVSLDKKTLCLAGGGHFKRFVDYSNVKNVYLSYYDMACFNCDWKCIFKFNRDEPYPCINNLEYAGVENIITNHLLSK